MKIRRINTEAITSTDPSVKLVSLTEADLKGVAGAACSFEISFEGRVIGTGNHATYEEGDGGGMLA